MKVQDLYVIKNLSEKAIQKIEEIRSSEPVRKVQSSSRNVSGTYPSRKMGLTIQFESRTVELAAIYEKEFNEEVLEYYDQPSTFPLRYEHKGKIRGHSYTPDFFVIGKDWIGWEEWKTEEQMKELIKKFPKRYCVDDQGNWFSPPAEVYAEQFDLGFRIRTSKEVNWTLQRNLRFLEDYINGESLSVEEQKQQLIHKIVSEKPGASLEYLFDFGFDADDLYILIATNQLYSELDTYLITEFDKFPVYINKKMAEAFKNLNSTYTENNNHVSVIDVYPGQHVNWNGQVCTILNVTGDSISLLNERTWLNYQLMHLRN